MSDDLNKKINMTLDDVSRMNRRRPQNIRFRPRGGSRFRDNNNNNYDRVNNYHQRGNRHINYTQNRNFQRNRNPSNNRLKRYEVSYQFFK